MKKTDIKLMLSLCGLTMILIFSMCCSSNKLQGYEFRERTASARMAHPSPPEIFTDNWTDVDFKNPVQAVIGIGTGIAKEVEVEKTRAKMDSAMGMIDIPEIVRAEILERGANYLHFLPIDNAKNSDYHFDIVMQHYGIDAKSWTASVNFKIDVKITLLDHVKNKEIWRSCFNESFPISNEFFGLPDAAGNIITMVSLSHLTANQISSGLQNLAVHTSDRIIHKLQEDFLKKNQQ